MNTRTSLTKTLAKSQPITLIFLLLSGSALYAADNWSIQPSIKQSGTWESNPMLLSGKHKSLYGSTTTPALAFSAATPTTKLTAFASVDENIFNQSDFSSTDFHGGVKLDRSLERWGALLEAKSDYDTTRTSELTTLNTSSVKSVRHWGNSFTPELYFRPSALDKISVSGGVQKSTYDSIQFKDYHILSVTPAYEYNITPLHTASLSLHAQRYQTDDDPKTRTDSFSPTLGWVAHITPILTAKASFGSQRYSNHGPALDGNKWKWKSIYSAELDFKGEHDLLNVTAKRDLQPYANGSESFLNTISVSDSHTINPLFSTNVGGSYQYSGIRSSTTNTLKSLKSVNAGLSYHATERVDISASYQYREQTLTNTIGKQSDNQAMLTLAYHPVLSFLDDR